MVTTIFDITSTVEQIISAERASLDYQIQKNQNRQEEIDGLSKVKTKLSSFISSMDALKLNATFDSKKTAVSDTAVVSASADVGAAEIQYDIDVTTLATAARVTSKSVLGLNEGTKTNLTGGEVNTTGGQSLDPNARIQDGGLNLDAGKTLTAGTFTINGVNIQVISADTVNTILTKINNSSANINAYYDEDTDKIILEHNEIGSSYNIVLGSDNTGFFDAMKLNGSQGEVETRGTNHDQYNKLNTTSLSGITAGYFTINNRTFYVDPANDSLNDVIKRINSSSAGVSVFYNEASDEIIMTSKVDGQDIVLKNDTTSGFLDAIHILDATGDQDGDPGKSTYIPAQSTVVVNGTTMHTDGNTLTISGTTFTFLSTGTSTVKVEPDHDKIVSAVGSMVYAYNAAVDTINQVREAETTSASGSTMLTRILTGMRSLLIQEVDNPYSYHYITDIGLSFSRGESRGKLELDETKLRSNLSTDTDSTVSIFSYDSDSNGLRDNGGIANVMKNYLYEYTRATGFIGQRQETISDSITQTQNQIQRKEDYFSKRRDILIETLVKMQTVLQQLEYNYTQAQAYQINFIKS